MSNESTPRIEDLFPLPPGYKPRRYVIGTTPVSPPIFLPVDGDQDDSSAPRPPFETSWEDKKLGIRAVVREREDGRLMAQAFCTDAALLNKGTVFVSFGSGRADFNIGKSVRLTAPEEDGCSGSAVLEPFAQVVKDLGPEVRLVLSLLV
jgi:hypothetical protein